MNRAKTEAGRNPRGAEVKVVEAVEAAPPAPKLQLPPAVENRDMHSLGWWALGRLFEGEVTAATVSAMAGVFRTLNALPPDGESEEENLANIALHGLLMHGIPPRNAEEWARAEAQFDDDALTEMRRWASLQGDARDQR